MKHFLFATAIGLICIGSTGFSLADDNSLQYYQAGNTFYSQKNYDQAIRYYQAAVQMNPKSWKAYQGLGNCYYAKGDKAKALTNYQKALDINPNNPQLTLFVQNLRSQLGSAPPQQAGNSKVQAMNNSLAWASSEKNFELNVGLGIAIDTGGSGVAFGGSAGGYYMMDSQLGFGGMIHFYSFGWSDTIPGGYRTQSGTWGNEIETDSNNAGCLEIVAALKYKLESGEDLTPYLVGGLGIVDIIYSSSTTYNLENGPPLWDIYNNTSSSSSQIYPVVEGGVGVEITAGKDLNIFGETRIDLIIGNGATETYIPIDAGLSFNL
jgi:hypothetical protein